MNSQAARAFAVAIAVMTLAAGNAPALEQRDEVSFPRGPYNGAFFHRENESFRISAAIHFAHAKQHDILLLQPVGKHEMTDGRTDAEYLEMLWHPPRTEPKMELFGPYAAKTFWQLYRAIDWTHMHHEQTYDILASKNIPWDRKKEWTDRAVAYYLDKLDIPMSPAPLDVTMRRVGAMMKPYFTLFRNYYPKSNNFFYVAHWWHPAVYEAQMLGGNDAEQEMMTRATDRTMYTKVLYDRPQRMILSRELMPTYARLSPESANIFDNLHMLHGFAYDILSYDKWSNEEKKKELYRVIKALSYQPGDEKIAKQFKIPHDRVDPRVYEEWMKGSEGEMNRIMFEMWDEMMPLMMPGGMDQGMMGQAKEQLRKKLAPGLEEGEHPGSLMDAMKKVMPDMKMSMESMAPGKSDPKMMEAMMKGWQEKYGNLPDVQPPDMGRDPSPPELKQPEGGAR